MSDVVAGFIDKGSLGLFIVVLLYAVHTLATRLDNRNVEDRKVFESLNTKIETSNHLTEALIKEQETTRNFFKATIDHERENSKYCFDIIHKTQLEKKEMIIRLNESVHNLVDRIERLERVPNA